MEIQNRMTLPEIWPLIPSYDSQAEPTHQSPYLPSQTPAKSKNYRFDNRDYCDQNNNTNLCTANKSIITSHNHRPNRWKYAKSEMEASHRSHKMKDIA